MYPIRHLILFMLLAASFTAHAADSGLDRLKAYITTDTVNPPGNEIRGARFFAAILDAEGIPYEIAESAPGRANIWARLKGGNEPALVLLHHMDVVPATAGAWHSNPLQATERDGYLYGRGTLDTKSLGIMHLQAFLALHRAGKPLKRDVVFMATADEEAGGLYGAGWMLKNHPEIFEGAGYLLNEGGAGSLVDGRQTFSIEVAQKRPYWLRLTATDIPGHGSMPRTSSAATRLIAALNRIQQNPFEVRVVPAVAQMFAGMAAGAGPEWSGAFADIGSALKDPAFVQRLHAERPELHALLRNTCSITMLSGSQKVNVVSPDAQAELDCRILPDQDAAAFLQGIKERIADTHIKVEETLLFGAGASRADNDLYQLLQRITQQNYPQATIVPAVATGFTDSHFFRDVGIACYGYGPWLIPGEDRSGPHGNDERISLAGFQRGLQVMQQVVEDFALQ